MKSLMGRLLVLLTVVALLLALSGPAAMANHLDGNDLDANDFGINDRDDLEDFFGHNLRNNDFGILSDFDDDCDDDNGIFRHHRDCDDDEDELRVIEVGDEECLVEEDDVLFCNEDENDAQAWLDAFFARNDAANA